MFKPFEIFNDIVKGLILGVYDLFILLVGPLVAPLRQRRIHIWRFMLGVEERLSSLTLMFICITGLVAVNTPGFVKDAIGPAHPKAALLQYRFLYLLILSTAFTLLFDLLFRLLVYLRTISLNVKFSRIRLDALRLYFSIALVGSVAVYSAAPYKQFFYRSEWTLTKQELVIALVALPFSVSLLHLTKRMRIPAKWLVAAFFSYSFANLALAFGSFAALVIGIFFQYRVDSEQLRLYAITTRCAFVGERTVAVETDLLLKTDWYDALQIDKGAVRVDLGNQIIELDAAGDAPTVLLADKVVHSKWRGNLLPDTDRPTESDLSKCVFMANNKFWSEPPRVGDLPDTW